MLEGLHFGAAINLTSKNDLTFSVHVFADLIRKDAGPITLEDHLSYRRVISQSVNSRYFQVKTLKHGHQGMIMGLTRRVLSQGLEQ